MPVIEGDKLLGSALNHISDMEEFWKKAAEATEANDVRHALSMADLHGNAARAIATVVSVAAALADRTARSNTPALHLLGGHAQ